MHAGETAVEGSWRALSEDARETGSALQFIAEPLSELFKAKKNTGPVSCLRCGAGS